MSIAGTNSGLASSSRKFYVPNILLFWGVFLLLALAISGFVPWLIRWPSEWIIPVKDWITDCFAWLGNDLDFGLFKFRDITRGFAWILSLVLHTAEVFLFRGSEYLGSILPIPWTVAVLAIGLVAHWIKGWRLSIFCVLSMLYLVFFGLWVDAMKTFSIVVVAVPFAASIGLALGIASTRSARVETILKAVFDFMQATPHMAYLAPIIVLFGFGQVPAMMATVIFAMPNMARCTILGIRTVPPSVIEAAIMSGCTQKQLLWKAELPAARSTLMLGVNQVIMQTLAMAVIASLVGASGLGQKLLFSLQQLRIGAATEQGIAIVMLAVILDRITQAAASRPPGIRLPDIFWQRHLHMIIFVSLGTLLIIFSHVWELLSVMPKEYTFSLSKTTDSAVRWISLNFYPIIKPFRDWITVSILLEIRNFYLSMPWIVLIGTIGVVSWYFGKWKLTILNCSLALFIMLSGVWKPAMMTLYLVNIAVIICACIGVPFGIWSAHNPRVAKIVLATCDTLQTFPSFIYLIPVIMLFKIGDLSNIIAILAYASVPAIRYTYLGLTNISKSTLDAATATGCTKFQKLIKVELPIAFPEIMLGINQTIMMALAMTAITALIGSKDLGQEILKALPGADTGRGLVAGLSIAFIGIISDRIINAWASKRKASLGM